VRFEKLADTLHPADSEAFTWLMNAQEGDTIEVKVGKRTSQQNNVLSG
jgi:NADPH-dependent ferric siderophore reductase